MGLKGVVALVTGGNGRLGSASALGAAVLEQFRARYLVESKKQERQPRRLPASTPIRNATVTA
jgi:NAD(P)-dependent dehydrogenase (short-subunit alcohol dehydrogenase family)